MAGSERSGFAVKRLGGLPGRLLSISNSPLRVLSNLLANYGGQDLRWRQWQWGILLRRLLWFSTLITQGVLGFVDRPRDWDKGSPIVTNTTLLTTNKSLLKPSPS